jgi:hypothetical protein
MPMAIPTPTPMGIGTSTRLVGTLAPPPSYPGDSEVWMERRAARALSDGASEQAATNWMNWRGCCAILLEQLPC